MTSPTREPRHADGVAVLSGSILKKLVTDYTDYIQVLSFGLLWSFCLMWKLHGGVDSLAQYLVLVVCSEYLC